MRTLIKKATIVNENTLFKADVLIKDAFIEAVYKTLPSNIDYDNCIDAEGLHLFPGIIDDQVHFREPGLTQKADIYTESRAAVAGGVTSFMEMPNTKPPVLTQKALEEKYQLGAEKSFANYSFYMGASNDNLDEVLKTNPKKVCGVKVFMGSSTGNMLVDDTSVLEEIFKQSPLLIATHCEDETTINRNTAIAKEKYGETPPISVHPEIRSVEACYLSSSKAVELAKKHNTRLHVLHLTTAKEMSLFDNKLPLKEKKITAEVCVHHLWFNDEAYDKKGSFVKWNPAIKTETDRKALFQAMQDNTIDVIATDHAPHLKEEKENTYFKAPSGGPLVQHSLQTMIEFYHKGDISLEKIVEKMCHHPAECFSVKKRGYIKAGYYADLVLVDLNAQQTVTKENIYYKCAWSPFEGEEFHSKIKSTFVNGSLVYDNGEFDESFRGMRLEFDRD